jgi:hypothetical protein
MIDQNTTENSTLRAEFNLKKIVIQVKDWFNYLTKKWFWIILIGMAGAVSGFLYASFDKPIYTATLTFALDEEKPSSGSGLSSALGLASSLGFDLTASAGGAFYGANLIELMRSRNIVEKALLNAFTINGKKQSLAMFFIDFNDLNKNWDTKNEIIIDNVNYQSGKDRIKDSLIGKLYDQIIGDAGVLSVYQRDRKVGIITIDVKSKNELFSKLFVESIAKEVSAYYIETKSKKARTNVAILQKQVDSVRSELNAAITGVATASDNVFNLNSALNVQKTPGTRRQVDVSANQAILTQLVTNLEMAKVTLMKETPLIQVIDRPVLPLNKEKLSKLLTLIQWGIVSGFLIIVFFVIERLIKDSYSSKIEPKI